MFTHFNRRNGAAKSRLFGGFIGLLAIAIPASLTLLAGCGGGSSDSGSSNTSSPTPTPTPTPSVSASPSESAKARAIRLNFVDNYIPTGVTQYLRWANNKNLRVFVGSPINNIRDKVASSTITSTQARDIVNLAITNWTNTTDSDFTFTVVDSASNADIQVYFVDTILRRDGSESAGVGITNYDFTEKIVSGINFGTLTSAVAQVKSSQASDNLVDTTAHELGHSIGIEQHSTNDQDLMFAQSIPPATITQRDQNTAFFLYYSSTANSGRAQATVAKTKSVHSREIE